MHQDSLEIKAKNEIVFEKIVRAKLTACMKTEVNLTGDKGNKSASCPA